VELRQVTPIYPEVQVKTVRTTLLLVMGLPGCDSPERKVRVRPFFFTHSVTFCIRAVSTSSESPLLLLSTVVTKQLDPTVSLPHLQPQTATFTETLKPHYNSAARYCKMLCGHAHRSDAEDVFQQSLLQAFDHFSSLRDVLSFRPWLFSIINRTYVRSKRRAFWQRFSPLDHVSLDDSSLHVYSDVEANEIKDQLMAALERLSEKEKSAILLFEIAGFSILEIAEIQNEKSISTVKMRLKRARTKLRELLDDENTRTAKQPQSTSIEHETLRLVAQARRR
jgi:RNA polymerase sigma-70 factor (ECF subfamily)